ncbi:hypothetical protein [Phormidesmis priestleyi]
MTQPIAPSSAFSSFVSNLPDLLQQPASLALFGSIGAHLFFFATLPAFTAPPAQPDLRSVRLVNLTPQEQSRLPQSPLTSQFGLPPLPNSGAKLNVPLGQPFPQSPLPDASQLYKIPDLSVPTPRVKPQPFDISRYIFKPNTQPLISPNRTPPQPNFDPTSPDKPPSQPFPPNTSGATDPTIPRLPSAPIVPPTEQNNQAANNQTPNNQTPNNPNLGNNPASPTPIQPTSPGDPLLEETRQLQKLYARENFVFDPMGASPGEWRQQATQNFAKWFEENITKKNIADENLEEKEIKSQLAYRSPAPLTEKYSPALVYILLDPQGKMVANPAVLGRSGYRYLDLLAERAINQQVKELKPTGKYVIYTITLTFTPEAQPPNTPTS